MSDSVFPLIVTPAAVASTLAGTLIVLAVQTNDVAMDLTFVPSSDEVQSVAGVDIRGARIEDARDNDLMNAFARIARFEHGWDGDDAEAPNGVALEHIQRALDVLIREGHVAHRLVAAVDGGVTAYFFREGGHLSIHCDNEGSVVVLDNDSRERPRAVEIDPEALEVLPALVATAITRGERAAAEG